MGLINHYAPLSTSEVRLNFDRDAGNTGAFGPGWSLQPGLKGVHWYRFVAPTGTNAHPLVPVGASNRDQRPPLPALWAAEKRPLVPVGGTSRD